MIKLITFLINGIESSTFVRVANLYHCSIMKSGQEWEKEESDIHLACLHQLITLNANHK